MGQPPQTVTFPGFENADRRRRRSVGIPIESPPAVGRTELVLAFAITAARSAGVPAVSLPVQTSAGWRQLEVDLEPPPSVATLRTALERELEEDDPVASSTQPPPNTAIIVLGDSIVDPSHVLLRFRRGSVELEGPVEPSGGVALLAGRIAHIAEQLTRRRALAEIPTCDPTESELLVDLRSGQALGPLRLLTDRIEQVARLTPHLPAVSTPWTTLTYDELIRITADRYAMLKQQGIARGDVVGLHLNRSTDLVATVLALWQIGAAFLPLSHDLPRARLSLMLDDARATRVVTDLGEWPPPTGLVDVVEVDRAVRERRSGKRRDKGPSLDDAAYVMFTSGSTGRPKGVVVSHRSLSHYAHAVSMAMPPPRRRGVMLAITPLSFDPSLLELFWPLTEGWEVVVDPGRDIPLGPIVRRRQVSHINGTPTMARLMMNDRDGTEVLRSVEQILLGGEPVRAELLRELHRVTEAPVTVCYGPTECTVDVTWGPASPVQDAGSVVIGRPLPGHEVDIVDRHGRSVGAFSLGELVVKGDAVANGYVVQPPDESPFGRDGNRHTYRTGDLVWSDASGVIHFAGRRDTQIKLRGHRIDLRAIDSRLLAHPDITAAASVVVGDVETRRIESFVVGREPVPDDVLRLWIQASLPEPMVPARVHWVSAIPLTTSGKTDYSNLHSLAANAAEVLVDRRELTSTEAMVAKMFESILGVAQVRPDLSLFELGGNSVSAVRLVSELEAVVDRRVSLTELLDGGSVEQIAAAIDDGRLGGSTGTVVTIVHAERGLPIYCVAGPDGHAVTLRPLGEATGRAFHGLEYAGTDGITTPDPSIEAMADRFASAIASHNGTTPIILGGYSSGGFVALETAKRLEAMGIHVVLLFLIDSMNPQLERRSKARKVMDGFRELNAPNDRSAINVVRNRMAAGRLSRADNLFSMARSGRVPNVVDLTPEFERVAHHWNPPTYDGAVLVVRSAALVPTYRGWERVLTGDLQAIGVDSGHVKMMVPPDVDNLAKGLCEVIERAERGHL